MKKELERHCLDTIGSALRFWDPIGVIDHNGLENLPNDEYDSYSPGLLRYLEIADNAKGVANYLAQIRSVAMGLGNGNPTGREVELGKILIDWRESGYKKKPNFRID